MLEVMTNYYKETSFVGSNLLSHNLRHNAAGKTPNWELNAIVLSLSVAKRQELNRFPIYNGILAAAPSPISDSVSYNNGHLMLSAELLRPVINTI